MMNIDKISITDECTPFASYIVKFQNSVAYPIVYALICAIAGVSGKNVYIPLLYLLTAMVVLSGIYSKDAKVFVVPAILSYYAIGMSTPEQFYSVRETVLEFDYSAIPHLVICGTLMVGAFLYRLSANGVLAEAFKKRGIFLGGLCFMGSVIVLNGAFSSFWKPINIIYGFVSCAALVIMYMLFSAALTVSRDTVAYACKTLVACAVSASVQIGVIMYRLYLGGALIITYKYSDIVRLNRIKLSLSWGVANLIGALIVLGIPAALYLARSRRYPALSYVLAIGFFAMAVVTDTRSAILCGGIMLAVGILFCLAGGKNKKFNRIFTAILFGCAAIVLCLFAYFYTDNLNDLIYDVLDYMRLDVLIGGEGIEKAFTGRIAIWKNGLDNFCKSILFGTGFSNGAVSDPELRAANFYSNAYHNIIIEFLATMGIVGILAFVFHIKHILEVVFRKFSVDRLLILFVPMLIIMLSLFDNFFFYANFQVIYAIFLVLAEKRLERKRMADLENTKLVEGERKPRVVFAYVEAGKGHIVPTRTVCEAFKKKYGDRAQIIESKFFSESGNKKMQKTEKLFERAVKSQNRSPIMSVLCRVANFLAGDTLALNILLSWTISGVQTAPLAVKHVEELDADVMFSAHWAIPYYVNKVKASRPRTVCFCPDIYSNGVFNVDCNKFLISSEEGYRKINKQRMYAGGNSEVVPFPMRSAILEYANKNGKHRARSELGISDEAFVVTLSDGGYGMAKLEKTVVGLMSSDQKMTVIALCGMNSKLCAKLKYIADNHRGGNVTLIPVGFTDNVAAYIAAADVFVGKSGANSMAEPCALGVPMIITKCITYIERGIKNYYVRTLLCAAYVPSVKRAVRLINKFAECPSLLNKYKGKLSNTQKSYDAEKIADVIWEQVEQSIRK